ncbi:MAG TPA: hypothetical protein VG248_03760 [Caulobacteraceae bacterium]|jgi:hypothetical protein|nr:hypothetical protein [Caulobacteraceae bacterium]
MTRSLRFLVLPLTLWLTTAPPAATAAQLVLDCQVQANRSDHGVTRWRRRIVLTSADHMARFFDDVGHGFQPRSAHRFVLVSRERIVLDAAAGKQSFVDRRTGTYMLRNMAARFELRGRCAGGADAPAGRQF